MSPESSVRPVVQDLAAREVAAAADQREAVAEVERLALPQLDARIGAQHPLAVVGVDVDRDAAERAAPLHEVARSSAGARSRSRAARRAPRPPRTGSSSSSVTQSQSTFEPPAGTSSARWPIANPGAAPMPSEAGVLAHLVAVVAAQLLERRPALALGRDVLALVLADGAGGGRFGALGVLDAAGDADEAGHASRLCQAASVNRRS